MTMDSAILCACGCGLPVTLSQRTGQPNTWRLHHNSKFVTRTPPADLTRYEIRDLGFVTPCWIWTAPLTRNGYGRVQVKGVGRQVHRVIYERKYGLVPAELQVDHLCRNRACVNVDHLEAVTQTENARRGAGTKITVEMAVAILTDQRPRNMVASEYGLSLRTIYAIRSGERWPEAKAIAESRASAIRRSQRFARDYVAVVSSLSRVA